MKYAAVHYESTARNHATTGAHLFQHVNETDVRPCVASKPASGTVATPCDFTQVVNPFVKYAPRSAAGMDLLMPPLA